MIGLFQMVNHYAIEPQVKVNKKQVEKALMKYMKTTITSEKLSDIEKDLKLVIPDGFKVIVQVDTGHFSYHKVSVTSKYLLDKKYDGYCSMSWFNEEFVVVTVYWIYFE